jgi:hypothetical protein
MWKRQTGAVPTTEFSWHKNFDKQYETNNAQKLPEEFDGGRAGAWVAENRNR